MRNRKLVMIPGPTPVVRSIQDQMGRETVAFGDSNFIKDFKELVEDLKTLWKTEGEVFVVAGTGTM
ncbi:MAG: aminotransferase, partial [Bacillota bacterium]|nr:aminotransferase [Bacillota bacterium]